MPEPEIKTSISVGTGATVYTEPLKDGKIRIVIEIDESKIARTILPGLLMQLRMPGDEPKEEKKVGRPKKGAPKPGEPGYDSKETPPLPFKETFPFGANGDKKPEPAAAS